MQLGYSNIDLHTHTSFSDGSLTPAELLQRAISRSINCLAITDHDNIDAIPFAHKFNNKLTNPLQIINGVEISADFNSLDIHIVALGFDVNNARMLELLAYNQEQRHARIKAIDMQLQKIGINSAYEGSLQFALNNKLLSRYHLASWMKEQGYSTSIAKVFNKYLVKGKVGYAPNNWQSVKEVVSVINAAGGYAVLAHPFRYKLNFTRTKSLVKYFKECGGSAIEVQNSAQARTERDSLLLLAENFDLYGSVGSDFHFPSPMIDLGKNLFIDNDKCNWLWNDPQWNEICVSSESYLSNL